MNHMSVPQWRPFLSLFAQELTQTLTPGLLGRLMHDTGVRFARQYVLAPAGTVAEMQDVMNHVWRELQWGEVEIDESEIRLVLTHRYAPLRAVFGAENDRWAGAFLEGVYEGWMQQLGADPRLRTTMAGAADASGTMIFSFGA
ncbi:hypothetical protein WM40_03495 [Robbsia andropogonis]|uniref:Cellulose synthase n=1 Tax=Robbsia andropogonis TaxID=28092 RepID=A0A0F5K4M1_9BURK|nr:hypothetical protein [Robbsia andropogonis]KKB65018.1 hypothetical protein WM40_03495 [Robbsia andropogonis]MCP1118583.1 cellulose synthase [Robbsia andropogonis]MCP1128050.1 cellulose synthase [Robbsia andropogonis]